MEYKKVMLRKLNGEYTYNQYMDNLLTIYNNLDKTLKTDIIVMGGMLYFLIEREAKFLNLIEDDANKYIYKKFRFFKSIDLDLQTNYNNNINETKKNCFNGILSVPRVIFKSLNIVLKNKPLKSLKKLPFNFGLNYANNDKEFDPLTLVEGRPQIIAKIDELEDHILEILIVEKPEEWKYYKFKSLEYTFKGQNIINSITQQIYPNERCWNKINFLNKSKKEIFKELGSIFKNDRIEKIKFDQGYYRVYMIYYIYKKAIEKNSKSIIELITPTATVLRNKLFYFKSRRMKLLASSDLLEEANILYKKLSSTILLPNIYVLQFLKLCLKLWNCFKLEI